MARSVGRRWRWRRWRRWTPPSVLRLGCACSGAAPEAGVVEIMQTCLRFRLRLVAIINGGTSLNEFGCHSRPPVRPPGRPSGGPTPRRTAALARRVGQATRGSGASASTPYFSIAAATSLAFASPAAASPDSTATTIVRGVDLEVRPQRCAGIGAAEAVGAERSERRGHEPGDLIRNRLQEVGHRHDRPASTLQGASHIGHSRCAARVEPVPALDFERVLAERLVARDRPGLGRHAPVGDESSHVPASRPARAVPENRIVAERPPSPLSPPTPPDSPARAARLRLRRPRPRPLRLRPRCGPGKAVDAAQDAVPDRRRGRRLRRLVAFRHRERRHRVVLVVERQVVDAVLGIRVRTCDGCRARRSSPSRRRTPGRRRGRSARPRRAGVNGRPRAAAPRRSGSCDRRCSRSGIPAPARRPTARSGRRRAGSRTSNRRGRSAASAPTRSRTRSRRPGSSPCRRPR